MGEDKNTILLSCSCGCSLLKLERDTSVKLYYLSHYLDSSYQQKNFYSLLKNKIKLIWLILSGKEYVFWDMIFTKEDLKKLYSFLKEDYKG
ncbi:MAG: hypothetical protein KatS3mg002_0989 [Candidatus Woesearchaeota archaeon]|nr:MAG: hypothetical protein KatS3mg002_0989 [Candidatus Woesearchaeota archaeon]